MKRCCWWRKWVGSLQTGRKYLQHEINKTWNIIVKGLVQQINNKRQTTQWKVWAKDLNRYLTKENIQITSKGFTSFVIRELQVKTTVRNCAQSLEWLKSEQLAIPNVGKNMDYSGTLIQYWWIVKWYNHLGELLAVLTQAYIYSITMQFHS